MTRCSSTSDDFAKLVEDQLAGVDCLKHGPDWLDRRKMGRVLVGVWGGDGIGPFHDQRLTHKSVSPPKLTKGAHVFYTVDAQAHWFLEGGSVGRLALVARVRLSHVERAYVFNT